MPDTIQTETYFADTKSLAVFAQDGPKPRFIVDLPAFKALVVGLEAGGHIPLHPGEPAIYHFLEGSGLMIVAGETVAVHPGVTVYAPSGAQRGINAHTRLVFLGAKGV